MISADRTEIKQEATKGKSKMKSDKEQALSKTNSILWSSINLVLYFFKLSIFLYIMWLLTIFSVKKYLQSIIYWLTAVN